MKSTFKSTIKFTGKVIIFFLLFLPSIILFPGFNAFADTYTQSAAKTPKEIYREYSNSIFLISSEEVSAGNKLVEYGTAFSIDKTGYLLTAAHLLENYEKNVGETFIKDQKGNTYPIISVSWINKDYDLAIVKIIGRFTPLPLISQKNVEVGEEITVISNPSGLQNTVSKGLLSAKREKDSISYVQLTSAISPGSSGGPIFNEQGYVMAVVQGILEDKHTQNLNFAVPVDYIPAQYMEMNMQQTNQGNAYNPLAMNGNSEYLKQNTNTISASTFNLQSIKSSSNAQTGVNTKSIIQSNQVGQNKASNQQVDKYAEALKLFKQGMLQYSYKQYSESIQSLTQAIQIKPDYLEAYILKQIIEYVAQAKTNENYVQTSAQTQVPIDQPLISEYNY